MGLCDLYVCPSGPKAVVKNITTKLFTNKIRLRSDGAIYRPDSFVLMLHYCANLKAIRYESTSLDRIVADKSQRVIVA